DPPLFLDPVCNPATADAHNGLDASPLAAHRDGNCVPDLLGRDVLHRHLPSSPPGAMKDSATDTPPTPRQIVEALLFVGVPPLSAEGAGEIVRNLTPEQLRQIIDEMNRDYRRQGRPYIVHAAEPGYTLVLKPQFRAIRERLAGSPREARLTPHSLDVLAL